MARLVLLLISLGLGTAIALLGRALTGDERWFLAVPAVLVLAWWFVADPRRCNPPGSETRAPSHDAADDRSP